MRRISTSLESPRSECHRGEGIPVDSSHLTRRALGRHHEPSRLAKWRKRPRLLHSSGVVEPSELRRVLSPWADSAVPFGQCRRAYGSLEGRIDQEGTPFWA